MQSILAERLKSMTFDLRNNEKQHFMKVQELHGGNTVRGDANGYDCLEEEIA